MSKEGSFTRRGAHACLIFTSFLTLTGIFWGSASPASAGQYLKLEAGVFDPAALSKLTTKSTQTSKVYVFQFDVRIDDVIKGQLRSLGFQPRSYLPEDALIVRSDFPISSKRMAELKALLPSLRAVSPFHSTWKFSRELAEELRSGAKVDFLLVTAVDPELTLRLIGDLRGLPVMEINSFTRSDLILSFKRAIRHEDLVRLAEIESIEWIQKLPAVTTFDYKVSIEASEAFEQEPPELTGYESGTRIMRFESAWERGFHGEGQVVAMADTGLDSGDLSTLHADLNTVISGHAMGYGSVTWEDPHGHGTHVAGSVVGTGELSNGIIRGGAPEASFIAQSMWTPFFNGISPGNDFNSLMGIPYREGARIHTNSWGSTGNFGSYETMAVRVDEFIWNNPDMLVLFAAGNNGQDRNADGRIDEGSISSPGTAKNVLTVGASENLLFEGGIQAPVKQLNGAAQKWPAEPIASDYLSDNSKGLAAFSSRGPTRDGRLKPEVVAPGTNILSLATSVRGASKLWGAYDENYVYSGGTSMSTPLVAAAGAVAREYLEKALKIENPSAALVKAMLMHTAEDLFPGQYGYGPKQELQHRRPNVHEGYGRVDMDALTSLGRETRFVDEKDGVALHEEKVYAVYAEEGDLLRVTLCYTDAPGSPSAGIALVNDIDLSITSPTGVKKIFSDPINNTQMVEMKVAESGTHFISAAGMNVPMGRDGKQPFALLITPVSTR